MGKGLRLEGWEDRLSALIEESRTQTFELGTHDCFRLACNTVKALTGVDRWPEFAGYKTEREVLEMLSKYGLSFEAVADWFFGEPSVPVRFARRGDVVAAMNADGDKVLGVSIGANAAFPAPEGLIYMPTQTCLTCWRVG